MITMKKKVLVAMAMAAAMVAMPVVAGAAVSPSQSESDGTIGNDSSSSSSSSNNTVSNSGNTENQNTPGVASGATKEAEKTVVQGANNERVEVVGTTKDSKGTTVGLVGNDAGKGSVSSDNGASVSIATGDAEVAGLSDGAKSDINDLNNGKAPSEVIPNSGLEDLRRIDRSEQDINTIGVQKTAPGIAHMQRLGLSFIFQTFVLSSRQLNNRGFSLIILNIIYAFVNNRIYGCCRT